MITKDLLNDEIYFLKIILIDENGTSLGIQNTKDALKAANIRGYDLLCISPNMQTPICKLVNYSKYKYAQEKKIKIIKKNQRSQKIKELQISVMIGSHDLEIKGNAARKWLQHGEKVKIVLRFRGREQTHPELGYDVVKKLVELLSDISTYEKKPYQENRDIIAVIVPKE